MYLLRELKREDIIFINEWRNDKSLIDNLGANFRYINYDVDDNWYNNYLQNRHTTVRCSIVDDKNCVLGLVSLTNIDCINRSAEFHIMIGNVENRGKGIGYFATKQLLNHAFNNLNLNRIELAVFDDNLRAVNLYKKVGFKQEGRKRQAIYKNGSYKDITMMAILKGEFNNEK